MRQDVAKCRHLDIIYRLIVTQTSCIVSKRFQAEITTMNKLPTELHDYICESACSEDGASVHALNIVSSYFHEVSKPYLYRNIAVSGADQISVLSKRLATVAPHLCRIDHLFLSDMPPQTKLDIHSSSIDQSSDWEDYHQLLPSVIQILAHASSTLQSFSLFSQSPVSTALIARVFRTTFPVLRRLSVHGFYPFLSSPKRFPRLEYLHLNGNRNPAGLLHLGTLGEACPTLKTLRITGLNSAGSFVAEVEDALSSSGADSDDASNSNDFATPYLPPQLKVLVVQAGPPPDPGLGKVVSLKDKVMMVGLEGLRKRKADEHSANVLVPKRALRSLSIEDMKDEWVAGI